MSFSTHIPETETGDHAGSASNTHYITIKHLSVADCNCIERTMNRYLAYVIMAGVFTKNNGSMDDVALKKNEDFYDKLMDRLIAQCGYTRIKKEKKK